MPIAQCGIPSFTLFNPPHPPQFIDGGPVLSQRGPTIIVEVAFDANLHQPDPSAVQAAASALAVTGHQPGTARTVQALIDTGAGDSCIDEALAAALQLPLIDQVNCGGVGGASVLNVYLGHVHIPALQYVQYGRFIGARLTAGGQQHEVLLGRSLLSRMVMTYDGITGSVTLSV